MLQKSQMVSSGVLYIAKRDISLVFAVQKFSISSKNRHTYKLKLVDHLKTPARIIKSWTWG